MTFGGATPLISIFHPSLVRRLIAIHKLPVL